MVSRNYSFDQYITNTTFPSFFKHCCTSKVNGTYSITYGQPQEKDDKIECTFTGQSHIQVDTELRTGDDEPIGSNTYVYDLPIYAKHTVYCTSNDRGRLTLSNWYASGTFSYESDNPDEDIVLDYSMV